MTHAISQSRLPHASTLRTSLRLRGQLSHSHLQFVILLLIASLGSISIDVFAFQLLSPLVVLPRGGISCRSQYVLYSSKTNGESKAADADETLDGTVNHQEYQPSEEIIKNSITKGEDVLNHDARNTTNQVTVNFTNGSNTRIRNDSEGVQLLTTLFSTSTLFTTNSRSEVPPMFLFPWGLWMKVRSTIPHIPQAKNNVNASYGGTSNKHKKRR